MFRGALKKILFRRLPRSAYARLQAEYHFLRLRRALASPGRAERTFGKDVLAFAARIGPGNLVLDIGAYLGGTAALFARAAGPSGRVIAFEPFHAAGLRETVRRLGLADRIEAVEAALGAEPGTVQPSVPLHAGIPLYSQANILGARTAAGDAGEVLEGKPVPLLRLDDFLAEAGISPASVAAVKIDVEGSEMGLFAGGERFFAAFRGPVLCELWFDRMPPPGWARLRSLGYACSYLGRDGNSRPAGTAAEMEAVSRGETYGNFLFEKN